MQKQKGIIKRYIFYKPDLNVINYKNIDNSSRSIAYANGNTEPHYFICYVHNGELEFVSYNKKTKLCENDFVICKPHEVYRVETVPNSDAWYCIITFSGRLFGDDDTALLRAFNNRDNGCDNFYNIEKMTNPEFVKSLAKLFEEYSKKNLCKAHFVSLIKMFASEICIEFDKIHPNDVEKYSKEYNLRIYDYICQNFNKNITTDTVAKKFFVSRWYVNNICRHFYKLSFKQTIADMRMWYARGLIIKNPDIRLVEVSQLCGYKDYSGFFKAYQGYFGISPKDDCKKYKSTGKFYTKIF